MEIAIMERIPSFNRTQSKRLKRENPNNLYNQPHYVLALTLAELPIPNKLMFAQTCKEFNEFMQSDPSLMRDLEETHEKYEVARATRDRELQREINDFWRSLRWMVLITVASFLAQAGIGCLYLYASYSAEADHPDCRILPYLETCGWCGIISWGLNLLVLMVQNNTYVLCQLRAGSHAVGAGLGHKPEIQFDLEAGEPLLDAEQQPAQVSEQHARLCTGILKVAQVIAGFVSFAACIVIWNMVQTNEVELLRDECGGFVYGLSFWLIYVLMSICLCLIPCYCCCICVVLIAALRR